MVEPESDPEMAKILKVICEYDDNSPEYLTPILTGHRGLRGISLDKKQRAIDLVKNAEALDVVGTAKRIELDEYEALSHTAGDHGSDLWVEPKEPTNFLRSLGFAGLSAVRKLREVRAIVGFNRGGQAPDPAFDGGAYEEPIAISRDRSALGYENRGEGVFLQFSAEALSEWLDRPCVVRRGNEFLVAETAWRAEFKRPSVGERRMVYILAHTFAHLLIRSISLYCGYSQTSLRERVLTSGDNDRWAGILLYTATSDADGSLGGLVSLALDPERLDAIVAHALTNTAICSSDPICALDEPGHGVLNGSACHACCITPETCCQRGNKFLDRNLVTPRTLHPDTSELCFFKL